ncbi:hypothetical protein [Pseudonocardia spirodelae]|uniref:Uncharacterized protein n=1 Tax=Pseudonocardia spirodelae TaxID=3133431 RepID=A0ABU8TCA6_9PSEU
MTIAGGWAGRLRSAHPSVVVGGAAGFVCGSLAVVTGVSALLTGTTVTSEPWRVAAAAGLTAVASGCYAAFFLVARRLSLRGTPRRPAGLLPDAVLRDLAAGRPVQARDEPQRAPRRGTGPGPGQGLDDPAAGVPVASPRAVVA